MKMGRLHEACHFGLLNHVKKYIEEGDDINSLDFNQRSPLYIACENFEEEIVSFLLLRGALADPQDVFSFLEKVPLHGTPLHAASRLGVGAWAVVDLLLSVGARVDAKDRFGRTPLHLACIATNVDTATSLLRAGADIDATDHTGATPLIVTTIPTGRLAPAYLEMVQLFVKNGADVNMCDHTGQTALHVACSNGEYFAAYELLMAGADPNAKTKSGYTPLFLSEHEFNEFGISAMLRSHGATDEN